MLLACLDRHLSVREPAPAPARPKRMTPATASPLDTEFLATYRDEGAGRSRRDAARTARRVLP
jgi:hypothetical protein